MAEQMIFKRYEMKYLITKEQQQIIKDAMKEYMIPDIHGRNVTGSLYYDTPDYTLIRRSMAGPVYKEKFRVRSYGVTKDDSEVFLELSKEKEFIDELRCRNGNLEISMSKKEVNIYEL